ncbi:hypothetical protein Tco_1353941 [Tanacetum coccineum]
MGDKNPIRNLKDYSRPSHKGYRNTIELPDGNNVVPLRSDTIRLVQNRCSFHGLWSEDPNQHLKDFLKLVDSVDLDVANRERMRLRRTAKLRNDIMMFQQHQGESLSEAWTHQIKFLLKGPQTASPIRFPQKRVYPEPRPQALETIFEARVQDYMTAHTERMERFENAIFKQREEINNRMAEMFRLLKELTASRTPKKMKEEKSVGNNGMVGKNIVEPNKSVVAKTLEEVNRDDEVNNMTSNGLVRSVEKDLTGEKVRELVETPRSQPVRWSVKPTIRFS